MLRTQRLTPEFLWPGKIDVPGQRHGTTFARALITSLVSRFRPDQAHLYIMEQQPAGLSEYARLPHCGGVFGPAEPDRIRRLVTWLDQETQRRAASRLVYGAESAPLIVVVIDGWKQFENRGNPALAESSLGPMLRDVIGSGPPLGIHIVPIGGQELMSGKVPALCNHRLLLPFPNEDNRRAHLRTGMTSPAPLPGRAIDAATGRLVQICQPTGAGPGLASSVETGHHPAAADPCRLPRRFLPLPTDIRVADLELPQPPPSPTWIPLGIGGPDTATAGIDLFETGPHVLFISGPPGSGRTSAVAALASALRSAGVGVLAVAPPQSPLRRILADDGETRVLVGGAVADSDLREAAATFGDRRYAVLLDDADRITVQPGRRTVDRPGALPAAVTAGMPSRSSSTACRNDTPSERITQSTTDEVPRIICHRCVAHQVEPYTQRTIRGRAACAVSSHRPKAALLGLSHPAAARTTGMARPAGDRR